MSTLNSEKINIRLSVVLLLAAFINFHKPFYGSLFILFFEISIIQLAYTSNNKKIYALFSLPRQYLVIPLFFLCSISTSTILLVIENHTNPQSIYGIIRYIQITTNVVFILLLTSYLNENRVKKDIFKWIPFSILIAVFITFYDYKLNPSSIMFQEDNRLIITSNVRQLGYIVMLGCIFCSNAILTQTSRKNTIYIAPLFIVNFSMLIWLGGRGALLAYGLSLLLSLLLLKIVKQKTLTKTITLIFLMITSCIISLPFNVFPWNGLNRFISSPDLTNLSIDQISSYRLLFWKESINFILERPILGFGPEAHIFKTNLGLLQPHNSILHSLLEFGVLGTIPFLIGLYCITRISINNYLKVSNSKNLLLFNFIISVLIHSLYSGTLYFAPSVIIFCIVTAYVLSENLRSNNQRTEYQITNVARNEK